MNTVFGLNGEQYCDRECQSAHWPIHKGKCRAPYTKPGWQPSWIVENRRPAFVNDDAIGTSFGTKKYLWGNCPAIDVLKLQENEGVDWHKDVKLLFAGTKGMISCPSSLQRILTFLTASGDIRNVVRTLVSLPLEYKNTVQLVINDLDIDIVARNFVLLITAIRSHDEKEAAEHMIHLWYSALVRQTDADFW